MAQAAVKSAALVVGSLILQAAQVVQVFLINQVVQVFLINQVAQA